MNEHIFTDIKDAHGLRIQFATGTNIRDLMVNNDTFRNCDWIAVTSQARLIDDTGEYVNAEDPNTKFAIIENVFFDNLKNWYNLTYTRTGWSTGDTEILSTETKQYILKALSPFNLSKGITHYYNALRIACTVTSEYSQVEDLVTYTGTDINNGEHKEPSFIVNDILPVGLCLLGAPPKYGKSFLSLELACCVAEGKSFFGHNTDKGTVLYLDLEGTPERIYKRSKTVCNGILPDNLYIANRSKAIEAGLLKQLNNWLKAVDNPKLIIIDTLARVKGKRGTEDAYTYDTRLLEPLHDLAEDNQIAVVVVTHTKKDTGFDMEDPYERIIGSQAQFGSSDTGWMIQGKRSDKTKSFFITGRDIEDSYDFKIELTDGKWHYIGTAKELAEQNQLSELREDLVAIYIISNVQSGNGSYTVTAQELLELIAVDTGRYPEPDAIRMSRHISRIANGLYEQFSISTKLPNKNGGKNGRQFIFTQE